jgi:hypothetical protein
MKKWPGMASIFTQVCGIGNSVPAKVRVKFKPKGGNAGRKRNVGQS